MQGTSGSAMPGEATTAAAFSTGWLASHLVCGHRARACAATTRVASNDQGVMAEAQAMIDDAYSCRDELGQAEIDAHLRPALERTLDDLDLGRLWVPEPGGQAGWVVGQWVKKAVLLYFRVQGQGHCRRWLCAGLRQGAASLCAWRRGRALQRSGARAGAGRLEAAWGVHGARRDTDAAIRQYRRVCGRRQHDRHLGRRPFSKQRAST
jgi:hypothetical protein